MRTSAVENDIVRDRVSMTGGAAFACFFGGLEYPEGGYLILTPVLRLAVFCCFYKFKHLDENVCSPCAFLGVSPCS